MSSAKGGPLTPVSAIAALVLGRRSTDGRANPIVVGVAAILTMGIPLWGIFCFGFFSSAPPIEQWRIIHWAVFFGSSWILISPSLVAQWELSALAGVLAKLRAFSVSQGIDADLCDRLRRSWRIAYLPSALLFAAFANFCFVFYRSYLAADFLILDGTLAFYLTLTILTITGFITGIGIGGVIYALWLLGRVFRENLEWQPFHADQRGGYGFLANFSVETAVLFSFGSVLIPAAVTIGNGVGFPLNIAIYGFTIFYAVLIVLIFAWPVTTLALNADRCRQGYLSDYSEGIAFAIAASRQLKQGGDGSPPCLADIERAATHIAPAERLIFIFDKIADRSILPFRLTLLARVIVASLAPLLLMLIQIVIERALSS